MGKLKKILLTAQRSVLEPGRINTTSQIHTHNNDDKKGHLKSKAGLQVGASSILFTCIKIK
jgi:hypothetical protein